MVLDCGRDVVPLRVYGLEGCNIAEGDDLRELKCHGTDGSGKGGVRLEGS